MNKSKLRRRSPTYLSPSPRELSPHIRATHIDSDGDTVMSASRPNSLVNPASSIRLPTLDEILSDSAPQPWTLSAFMAYLSQNHCLETLEFTMEAERYRQAYSQVMHEQTGYQVDHVCELWQKLIHAYIQPYGVREVNLPAHVRDHLLSLSASSLPPHPSELDEAVRIVYDLMNDSVLLSFLESLAPPPTDHYAEGWTQDARQGRSKLRIPRDLASSREDSSRSPKASFLPQLNIGRRSEGLSHSASSSTEPADRGELTDDSGSHSPPSLEPMTPPTTPPTSDWAFASTSPGTIQRAISAHNSGWKKMGAKLGFSKKSRSSRRSHTSNAKNTSVSDVNLQSSDPTSSSGSSHNNVL